MARKPRLAVFASGNGSNLQAIIDACEGGDLPAVVVIVVGNRKDARALDRAERHGITAIYHPLKWYLDTGRSREDYDAALADLIAPYEPDWIVLAGWMHVLSMAFLARYPDKVINLHPALPGQFPGIHAIERAFDAYQRGEITETGIMVHLVPDAGVDVGPALATHTIPILPDDTIDTLTERVHASEHELLVSTIRGLVTSQINTEHGPRP
jgi:phosphoribosylglycinamide formyltransferase 1